MTVGSILAERSHSRPQQGDVDDIGERREVDAAPAVGGSEPSRDAHLGNFQTPECRRR